SSFRSSLAHLLLLHSFPTRRSSDLVLPFVLGSESAPALFEGYNPGLALPPCRMRLLGAEPRPDGSVLLRYAPDPLPFSQNRNSRSEEHTSELQSRENLVCRLLLEKK